MKRTRDNGLAKEARMVGVLLMSMSLAVGCAPLKKKFIRQKKKSAQNEKFIPVLSPITYPIQVTSSAQRYQKEYSLCRVWIADLLQKVLNERSEKRIKFMMDQVLAQMDKMMLELTGASQEGLAHWREQMRTLRRYMDKPTGLRNMKDVHRKITRIDSALRREFKPGPPLEHAGAMR